MPFFYLLVAALGYLLGSIPVGYLVGRAHGIDVREHGSGNIGATNVVRVLGKKSGYFVFVCDALKGLLAVQGGYFVFRQFSGSSVALAGIIAALACILGHNYPVWLRFRGGKGVATTVGTLLGLMPLAVLAVTVVWVAAFLISRYVSVASLLAAAALPAAVWALGRVYPSLGGAAPMLWFSLAAAALVWWRHRTNLQRLFDGTEKRFVRKAKSP